MDLETFEKLVNEHLFILQNETLSKKGARKFRIFGKEALYKQLMLGGVSNRRELYFAFMEEYNALMGESEHQILKEEVEVLLVKYCC